MIIEYDGGTKGDFLTNFLCGISNFGANGSSNTNSGINFLKALITFPADTNTIIEKLYDLTDRKALPCHKTTATWIFN
jgi:hypothetical protein